MRISSLLVSALLIPACGASTAPPASPTAPTPAVDLRGRWHSDCAPTPDGKGHFDMTFANTATRWTMRYVVYGDAACSTAARLVAVDVAGPYEVGAAAPGIPGAYTAVMRFDKKTITPVIQPLADALDAMPECGGGFAVGAARDVYAQGCPGFGQYPRAQCAADYDLVAIAGDELRFGDRPADNNLCSAERRPAALSQLVIHRQ